MDNFSKDEAVQTDLYNNDVDKIQAGIPETYQISLLEEKLVVKRSKLKVGEVVVRKEVETRMVHLPIRREKLIIEKVGATNEHLTEVDLGEGEINGVKFSELGNTNDIYQVQSGFISLEAVKQLLAKIDNLYQNESGAGANIQPTDRSNSKNVKVRLEIITDNSQSQQTFQDLCDSMDSSFN
ncbi:DUF2382 domain-containing protein [Pleurocapsa sp. FMAR1]|uniref:DUF2382 domain-containing protein n=1 Tax=Pleurocapsa sp. FMAR1 TaxID=3040204 RepID=UPI0029C8D729|nr:DUF2382 domain-containing protein [Pleurocapsa sp. FMAR1]